MDSIGTQLEHSGWRQGSIVEQADVQHLLGNTTINYDDGIILIVASQSCDIANNTIESDPFVEFSLAHRIEALSGHLTFNKNPRTLHTQIHTRTEDEQILAHELIELRAFEKILVPKEQLLDLLPDPNRTFEESLLVNYVAWLSARYSRPALPTSFNDRIRSADPKGKLRDKAKKASHELAGIYVEIIPNTEIADDESYSANLLGLLPGGHTGSAEKAKNAIDAYADVLRNAGMEVSSAVRTEDDISVALLRRFKRIYFDDLSYRDDSTLPIEATAII